MGATLVLLVTAGLFARTLRNLRSIDLGFQPENVALISLNVSQTTHSGEAAGPFFEEVLRRARALPGARAASLAGISVLKEMGAVKIAQGVLVFGKVCRHPIEDHTNAMLVEAVNEVHQVLRGAIATGRSKVA